MATSLAALRALEARSGRRLAEFCGCVAGHSLGEYSALAAAGSLGIDDAARLLRLRGQAMQAAVPVGEGAMAAILGLELDGGRGGRGRGERDGVCDVANDNAPGQVVVSGDARGGRARPSSSPRRRAPGAMLLAVSAPFHCRAAGAGRRAMAAALADDRDHAARGAADRQRHRRARARSRAIRRLLVEQVTARVRWRECLLHGRARASTRSSSSAPAGC